MPPPPASADRWRPGSKRDPFPDRDGLLDFGRSGHQRESNVAFAASTERLAWADDDAVLQEPRAECLRILARHFDPQVDRPLAARHVVAVVSQKRGQAIAFGAEDGPPLGDMRVVRPPRDGGGLDEIL